MKEKTLDKIIGYCFAIALIIFTLKLFILPVGMLVNGDLWGLLFLFITIGISVFVAFIIREIYKELIR